MSSEVYWDVFVYWETKKRLDSVALMYIQHCIHGDPSLKIYTRACLHSTLLEARHSSACGREPYRLGEVPLTYIFIWVYGPGPEMVTVTLNTTC